MCKSLALIFTACIMASWVSLSFRSSCAFLASEPSRKSSAAMAAWQHATTKTKKLSTTTGREKMVAAASVSLVTLVSFWEIFAMAFPMMCA